MKGLFLFPISSRIGVPNPYINDLSKSLEKYIQIVNKDASSNIGIYNILRYLFKIKFAYFNWPEGIPARKGGFFQTYFFVCFVYLMKILDIKIIWTMHNKISHNDYCFKRKKLIFNLLTIKSDLIITHSREGINYANESGIKQSTKCVYIPHPINSIKKQTTHFNKSIDILIWGTLYPYKGVYEFLEFLAKNKMDRKFQIRIVGHCPSQDYKSKLYEFVNSNIDISYEYIDKVTLTRLINNSRIVLFTYLKTSILSSGTLMETLAHHAKIVGPNIAAFKDLADAGIILTYTDFNHLIELVCNILNHKWDLDSWQLEQFIERNSWSNFGYRIITELNCLLEK